MENNGNAKINVSWFRSARDLSPLWKTSTCRCQMIQVIYRSILIIKSLFWHRQVDAFQSGDKSRALRNQKTILFVLKHRCVTLIEILISLSLTTLLLSSLAYFYHQFDWLNRQSENMQHSAYYDRYVQTRLSAVISHIQPEYKSSQPYFFFTVKEPLPSLFFIYNNGINDDPAAADLQLGKLFVTANKQLCLASWPISKKWQLNIPESGRIELLLEQVESLDFAFYIPPERDRSKVDAAISKKINTQEIVSLHGSEWVSEWRQENGFLPALIKIIVAKKDKEKVLYSFLLPSSKKLIVYEQ